LKANDVNLGVAVRRREFIGILAGATLPVRARAQPSRAGMRRLGVLAVTAASDPVAQARTAVLIEALAALDWKDGSNLRIDWRNGSGDRRLITRFASELVALAPDVLLAIGSPSVEELRRRTSTTPIVFAVVTDPIGQGFVASLSLPGGNITGFTDFDEPMVGKWLEMLTQITPPAVRAVVLYNPATAPFAGLMLRAMQGAARSLAVAVQAAPVRDQAGIAAVIAALAAAKNTALLVLPDYFTIANRSVILAAAAQANLPAVYWNRVFVADGGLMSYGTDNNDLVRRAAVYVDRILKGERPSELPVQNPTKFDLMINLRTAKALGVTISPSLLVTADEVIE
jgi:putative tryptophan/tyrosine transport system substrate-binding protein